VVRACPELDDGTGNLKASLKQTRTFVEDVMTETMQLFPSPWIQVGAIAVDGENAPAEGTAKKAEDSGESGDFGPLLRGLVVFLKQHGRTPMAWDSAMKDGVDSDCVICWTDDTRPDVLRAALQNGNHVVLCPRTPCFFNYPQDRLYLGDKASPCNTLENVYRGPRLPADIPAARLSQILGAEACLWTDRIATEKYLEFSFVPRLAAFAEMAWTSDERRDFNSFLARERNFIRLYQMMNFAYYDFDNPIESLRKASADEPDKAEKVPLPPSAKRPGMRY
jgi:hexosaminidase